MNKTQKITAIAIAVAWGVIAICWLVGKDYNNCVHCVLLAMYTVLYLRSESRTARIARMLDATERDLDSTLAKLEEAESQVGSLYETVLAKNRKIAKLKKELWKRKEK